MLLASTSTSGFNSSLLGSLRLVSTRASSFHACSGLQRSFGLWRVLLTSMSKSILLQHKLVEAVPAGCKGRWLPWLAVTGHWPASEQSEYTVERPPAAQLPRLLCYQWILKLSFQVYILVYWRPGWSYSDSELCRGQVQQGLCSWALGWSACAEAACLPEAWFQVNQTIIAQYYVIITSLLSLVTVIIRTLLPIIMSLLHHYYLLWQ